MRSDTLNVDVGIRTGCPKLDENVFTCPTRMALATARATTDGCTYTGGSNLMATLLLLGGMKNLACGAKVLDAAAHEVVAALSACDFGAAVSGSELKRS